MTFHLVKKDFLLIKNYLLLIVIFSITVPIFISKQTSSIGADYVSLLISEIFITYMFYGSVSTQEQKTKGAILICTTPFTRKAFVQAKYLFILSLYFICLFFYAFASLFAFTNIPPVSLSNIGISLMVIAIYFSITIPIEFKFGYDVTRYITVIAVMSSTFLFPQIAKWIAMNNINLTINLPIPQLLNDVILIIIAIILGYISNIVSIKIYSRKSF